MGGVSSIKLNYVVRQVCTVLTRFGSPREPTLTITIAKAPYVKVFRERLTTLRNAGSRTGDVIGVTVFQNASRQWQ
jgi:hypothetical protein